MKSLSMTIKYITFFFLICSSSLIYGSSIFDLSAPDQFVNDYANLLDEYQEGQLEKKILEFENTSSNQIAIVTVSDLEGMRPAQFARKLGNKWGVGQKGKDNGILILIKPKYKNEKGEVYIAVGNGLEHTISNSVAQEIIDNKLIPHFKNKEFYKGLSEATDSIIKTYSGSKSIFYISNPKTLVIYLIISILLLPFIYIKYLKRKKVPEKYSYYYIHGAYNKENLMAQIKNMEKALNQTFPKFKRLIEHYDYISKGNIIKYVSQIDSYMFCYLLNGRDRGKVFWELADPFLKFMGIYFISVGGIISLISLQHEGIFAFIFTMIVFVIAFFVLFSFLGPIIEISQYSLRKNEQNVSGISLAVFCLNTQFKRNIKKSYDSTSNSYHYYPHFLIASSAFGGGTGGFGGGFGGGGFGGGSFGGGGAGGSW